MGKDEQNMDAIMVALEKYLKRVVRELVGIRAELVLFRNALLAAKPANSDIAAAHEIIEAMRQDNIGLQNTIEVLNRRIRNDSRPSGVPVGRPPKRQESD